MSNDMGDELFTRERDQPPLSEFDLSDLRQPSDGVLYMYRSAVDGFWYIDNLEDMALQEATNLPVGEIIDYEKHGDYEPGEYGELRALFVPVPDTPEDDETVTDPIFCSACETQPGLEESDSGAVVTCSCSTVEYPDRVVSLRDMESESLPEAWEQ